MSKTDKTRPWQVRASDRPMHTCVPVHQHHNGVCDLPDVTTDNVVWFERDQCYWTYGPAFLYGRDHGCGCPTCTAQAWRRAERRATRHAAARVSRAAQRTFRTGLGAEEVEESGYDDYVPPIPCFW